jgi:DNA-binding NtrC family response regulator
MAKRILLVEDEDKLRRALELHLRSLGFEVTVAPSAEDALSAIDRSDLILSDLRLPGMDGVEFLSRIRLTNSVSPVILMTAYGTVESAVDAMRKGASDFLTKPFSLDHLTSVMERALEMRALRDENRKLREELGKRYDLENIIGRSEPMQEVFQLVMRVAAAKSTVLIAGESGVGKDLIARAIHYHSPRRERPFVKINCTAIPENLMESELFGYDKGAFTGANTAKPGKFEEANTGTVFLDEIGDVTPAVQVKLLRILQEREFERLGSNKTIGIDVRVIAATNQDLRVALEQGTFREDLFYRLNVVPINVPPLRKRKDDIPYLAQYFLDKFARESGRQMEGLTDDALRMLESHYWPGNVRELENVIERAVVLARSPRLTPADIRLDDIHKKPVTADDSFLPPGMTLDEYEKWLIQEALRRAKGNKSQAARLLGITRNAFRYRLSQTGIENGEGED